jgi:hypothetical protein
MKTTLLLCALFAGVGSLAAQPVTVPALGPRYKQTRERAEILFGARNGSFPVPDARIGLFQPPTETSPSVTQAAKSPVIEKPVASDETLLNEILAMLTKSKGGGLVAVGNRTVLTFGQNVYREGDILAVPMREGPVRVRITRISGNSVTLALNDSEVVWRF